MHDYAPAHVPVKVANHLLVLENVELRELGESTLSPHVKLASKVNLEAKPLDCDERSEERSVELV